MDGDRAHRLTLRPAAVPGSAGGCGNRLLDLLLRSDRESMLEASLDRINLPFGRVLFEPGDNVTHALFPCEGTVLTMLTVMSDGTVVEAASVGCEGALGTIVSEGHKPAFCRATVQVPGPVIRIEASRLRAAKVRLPGVRDGLARYNEALLAQMAQSVACSALHSAEARTCRWLLTLHDRVGAESVPVTQEGLAEMLGVRRTTVTRLLSGLGTERLIERRRGRVFIADRPGLERKACECYRAVRHHFERIAPGLYPPPPRTPPAKRGS